ncbi:hypothetical protein HO173_009857 [Letharia columbiana]|uniref:STE24 endopeptidase n=1 Tax=Letharia columbiana TaxID=112416 RepID=A0A8H6L1H5_9LECA|nr:uncharacterized protein HO173_009857 [Letharia columbiana]KAF6232020.1 hypothetical protein HO173_009857 [Letharia columbiana]
MPTPLDRAMQSRNAFFAFAGIVTAVSAWSIWGGEMFPGEKDPVGDPSKWADSELKRWLEVRGLLPDKKATREDLLERVKANMRPQPRS